MYFSSVAGVLLSSPYLHLALLQTESNRASAVAAHRSDSPHCSNQVLSSGVISTQHPLNHPEVKRLNEVSAGAVQTILKLQES